MKEKRKHHPLTMRTRLALAVVLVLFVGAVALTLFIRLIPSDIAQTEAAIITQNRGRETQAVAMQQAQNEWRATPIARFATQRAEQALLPTLDPLDPTNQPALHQTALQLTSRATDYLCRDDTFVGDDVGNQAAIEAVLHENDIAVVDVYVSAYYHHCSDYLITALPYPDYARYFVEISLRVDNRILDDPEALGNRIADIVDALSDISITSHNDYLDITFVSSQTLRWHSDFDSLRDAYGDGLRGAELFEIGVVR